MDLPQISVECLGEYICGEFIKEMRERYKKECKDFLDSIQIKVYEDIEKLGLFTQTFDGEK